MILKFSWQIYQMMNILVIHQKWNKVIFNYIYIIIFYYIYININITDYLNKERSSSESNS